MLQVVVERWSKKAELVRSDCQPEHFETVTTKDDVIACVVYLSFISRPKNAWHGDATHNYVPCTHISIIMYD